MVVNLKSVRIITVFFILCALRENWNIKQTKHNSTIAGVLSGQVKVHKASNLVQKEDRYVY